MTWLVQDCSGLEPRLVSPKLKPGGGSTVRPPPPIWSLPRQQQSSVPVTRVGWNTDKRKLTDMTLRQLTPRAHVGRGLYSVTLPRWHSPAK